MILSLRQRHRRVFAVLGVLLPVAFGIGIVARRSVTPVEFLPPELSPQTQTFTATDHERADLFTRSGIKVRLWQDLSTRQCAVGFLAPKDFVKPDQIVYWLAGQPGVLDKVPATATLLGSFVATVLPLPNEATEKEGVLILFSLADQEIVEISKPVRFNAPTH